MLEYLPAMAVREQGANGKVTFREIADLAGVSIATVSRVVNGRGVQRRLGYRGGSAHHRDRRAKRVWNARV